MSLSEKLSQAKADASALTCKVAKILSKLPKKDQTILNELMAVSYDDPTSVSNVTLSQLLREEV